MPTETSPHREQRERRSGAFPERPLLRGHIRLTAKTAADRVLVEVEDECGGLPEGQSEELFHSFEQRGDDRTGLGLGLSISRRGVEANGGTVRVRNIAGKGCVFTIDLPRRSHAP